MKANFEIISGNSTMNELMKASDMFEHGRILGEISSFSITYNTDIDIKRES